MAWETEEELETAWLGGYGPEEEREAEAFIQECLDGDHGEPVQADASSMCDRLETYLDEGLPYGAELAAELEQAEGEEVEPDVDAAELSAAEQRVIAAEQEDHFTSLLAAEVERFADQVKGLPLTPGEIEEVMALVPTETLEGGAFPDLVGQHGPELKERWSTREHRLEASAEVIRGLPDDHERAGDDGDDNGDHLMDRSERVNRGAEAVAALQAADGDEGE